MTHNHPDAPLYKYHKREYIEDLTRSGRIFIGTLEYYRTLEAAGSMIPDKEEGKKTLTEMVFALTKDTPAPLTRKAFGIPAGTAPHRDTVIRNNPIRARYETKDLWLYCMSNRLMSLAEAREREVFDANYDAVAVVWDREYFSYLIAWELQRRHPIDPDFFEVLVRYREREYPYDQDDGLDPACIKPLRFSRQNEVRFIYPTHTPISQKGILLDIPELRSCCRILKDEEIPK